MEPQTQHTPVKIARFADLGIGLANLGDSWNMESGNMLSDGGGDGSPPVGLGLELGRGSSHRPTGFTKSYGFKVFQVQELQLQFFIYKYMEAGLPVPNHLLLPILKSVVGGLHGSPYKLYSGFLGCGHCTWSTRMEWIQSQEDVEVQMGRNGGSAKKLSQITNTARDTGTEAVSVQES